MPVHGDHLIIFRMSRKIHTHFLPSLFDPAELAGGTAVVIDVLRASTTICHALAAGANAVVPCVDVEQARKLAAGLKAEEPVLGGERNGKLIDGFDLDNSPFAYTEEVVGGKTVIFTTTNGTRALARCAQAERVLIASFNNLSAVIDEVVGRDGVLHIVCAGTDGQISQEDVLLAGCLANELMQSIEEFPEDDDSTNIAYEYYQMNFGELVVESLTNSRGGRNLQKLGLDDDIERAAEVNRFDFVPVYSTKSGRITK